MLYCLNTKLRRGHENPEYSIRCKDCDFLVKGALIDDYEIVSFIGKGSFGDVYEVREPPPLARKFALKILRSDLSGDTASGAFSIEARRIAELQHQNILPVHKFGKLEDDRPYFIMECAASTLSQLFRKTDGSPRLAFAEELVPFIQQAAEALHYIHQNGYIHQDVKPVNLLIGEKLINGEKQLFLADFGTAFYLGMQTHASLGESMGTYAYMAPEQLKGYPRRESDQYALAISCYQLLAGRPPFVYQTLQQMWYAQVYEQPPHPQQWNTRIPVEVVDVLFRAMAKDYHQRYQSILEFAESYKSAVDLALQRYLCQVCGYQNRSGAQRCSKCGAEYDNRTCPFCDTSVRFGQRCCAACGRLTITPNMEEYSAFIGLSMRQGRYVIKRVLKNTQETKVLVAVAQDAQAKDQQVVLKRWPCINLEKDLQRYKSASEPLIRLRHPLVPRILDHFVEGKNYYHVLTYINGESLEDRLHKLLRPLSEREVLGYMNSLLNILIALEQQQVSYNYCDITPANIILENIRERAFLTGFQLPYRITRKLNLAMVISPYLPLAGAYDQRALMYSLSACMHHALTNHPPAIGIAYSRVRDLNPGISPELEAILGRALMENSNARYQSYAEMQSDIRQLM